MDRERILIVDDDKNICELLRLYLEKEGYETAMAHDGESALTVFDERHFDLVLLDVMMPRVDGWEACRRIRAKGNTPIIMLTAKGETFDKVLGLELGADDYVVKPFDTKEVVARIKAVLRRTNAGSEHAQTPQLTTLTFGSLEIQPERYSVRLGGQSISCTPREVELLYLLASHPGRVFDREQILSRIWGYDFFGDTRTVDTHIKRLRQKLACEEMGRVWDIVTVYGVGYKFEANL